MKRRHVQSSIVIPIESRSRQDTISEMKRSEKKEDVVRNQRLFGNLLLGTLGKFRKEEGNAAPSVVAQSKKLSEIDKRLEKTKEEARERAHLQKQELYEKRREEKFEVIKQRRQKAIELNTMEKEAHFRRLQKFIQTRANPPIFYLPAKHTPQTEELLAESSKSIERLIEKLKEDSERQLKGDAMDDEDLNPGKLTSRVATHDEDDDEEEEEEPSNKSEDNSSAAENNGNGAENAENDEEEPSSKKQHIEYESS